MRIVAATRNKKKLSELARLLGDIKGLELLGLDSFPDCPEVEETGGTFEENSLLKARSAAKCTGLWALADDSGLEVDALGGAPGIFSSRYAGPDADDKKNVQKLLSALEGVPPERRTARFRVVVTLISPEDETHLFEGKVEGSIGHKAEGGSGFGYDPVFYPRGFDLTFAQMPPAEKDKISHRAEALGRLKAHLRRILA